MYKLSKIKHNAGTTSDNIMQPHAFCSLYCISISTVTTLLFPRPLFPLNIPKLTLYNTLGTWILFFYLFDLYRTLLLSESLAACTNITEPKCKFLSAYL